MPFADSYDSSKQFSSSFCSLFIHFLSSLPRTQTPPHSLTLNLKPVSKDIHDHIFKKHTEDEIKFVFIFQNQT